MGGENGFGSRRDCCFDRLGINRQRIGLDISKLNRTALPQRTGGSRDIRKRGSDNFPCHA